MKILASCLATALFAVTAANAAVKPEDAIDYRQAVYTMIGWNFGPLAQMVKGKTTWDAGEFARRADRIAALAPQVLEGFPPGSQSGAKTDAKPDIWTGMDDFKSKLDDFVKQSKALADIAKGGDEAKMKEQFKTTAATCKACHDKYRNED
jgi:cytochrome c556